MICDRSHILCSITEQADRLHMRSNRVSYLHSLPGGGNRAAVSKQKGETLHPGPGRLVVPFLGGFFNSGASAMTLFPLLCLFPSFCCLVLCIIRLSFGLVVFVFFLVESHKILIWVPLFLASFAWINISFDFRASKHWRSITYLLCLSFVGPHTTAALLVKYVWAHEKRQKMCEVANLRTNTYHKLFNLLQRRKKGLLIKL